MKILNIGCGNDIRDNCINLDCVSLPGVNVVHDLNIYPYPFEDNKFDIIYCQHVLEHLSDIVAPLEEMWRISKNGAQIYIEVPSFPGVGAVVDPTHKSYYTYGTFDYFGENRLFEHYSYAKYRIISRRIAFSSAMPPFTILNKFMNWFVNLSGRMQRVYFWNFSYVYPSSTLYVQLQVLK